MTTLQQVQALYKDYPEIPYISSQRDMDKFMSEVSQNSSKLVPKRNMIRLKEGILPGHIILLWRIQFGTYTSETINPKYFEYTYGIDAVKALHELIEAGYVKQLTASESLCYINANQLKQWLKTKDVKGLSKLKRKELDELMYQLYDDSQLAQLYTIRGYRLTSQGQKVFDHYPEIVDKHPQKKF